MDSGYRDSGNRAAVVAIAFALVLILILISPAPIGAQGAVGITNHEAWMAQYWDGSGQQVSTVAGKTQFTLNSDWRMGIKALGEWIRIPGMPDTGSHGHANHNHGDDDPGGASADVDAVSGASIQAHGHHGSGEGRGEATLSLTRDMGGGGNRPASLGGAIRYSGESDFHSFMANLNGGIELFQRNTALSGYVGAGTDISDPDQAPPGQAASWPASSSRLAAGVQLGQLLFPRVRMGLSYSISILSGTLENPYRRARIITTLFPERLPDTRYRHVVGSEWGAYLGLGVALFHRQGGYVDSWGVRAWIPETALPMEIGDRWMVVPRHKYYYQLPADFHRTSYASLKGSYTGDVRLGHLEAHELGMEVEYSLGQGNRSSALTLSGTFTHQTNLSGNRKDRSYVMALGWRSPG